MKRLFGALLLVIFLTPINAYAHSTLVTSNPKSGAVLSKSPNSISLTFNENLIKIAGKNVSRLSLTDSNNSVIKLGKATINKSRITAKINSALGKGNYKIRYRVVSSDGHPISGTIEFRIK